MIDNLSWVTAYPEILLLVMACVIALVDLGVKTPTRTVTYGLSLLTLAAVALLQGLYASTGVTVYSFGNMVVSDPMGNWLKCFAAIAMMATLVYGRPYAADRDMLRGGELFTLSLFSLLGMFVMISGNNFLVLYLGLELLTLSSYALVALRRDNGVATEAAMKYFVLGAMASGFLLYGCRCSMAPPARWTSTPCSKWWPQARSSTKCWSWAWCSWSAAWRSSWAWCLSTCGFPMFTRVRLQRSLC